MSSSPLLVLPPLTVPLRVPKQDCLQRPPVKQGKFLATTTRPLLHTLSDLGHQRLWGRRIEGAKRQHVYMGPDCGVSGECICYGKVMDEGRGRRQGLCSVATCKNPHPSDPGRLPEMMLTLGLQLSCPTEGRAGAIRKPGRARGLRHRFHKERRQGLG